MEFINVYRKNDGNVLRGAITDKKSGDLVCNPANNVWFNKGSGMMIEVVNGLSRRDVTCYSYSNLPGDGTFRVNFFPKSFEVKDFSEIVKGPVRTGNKKTIKKTAKKVSN